MVLEAEIGEFIAQAQVQLNPGDVVVLYTDGISEAFDINKAQYGLKRLWQVVVENRQRRALEIREAVINDLLQYSGSQKSEVCPMPYALCPMPYALCPMPTRTSYESSKGYILAL